MRTFTLVQSMNGFWFVNASQMNNITVILRIMKPSVQDLTFESMNKYIQYLGYFGVNKSTNYFINTIINQKALTLLESKNLSNFEMLSCLARD